MNKISSDQINKQFGISPDIIKRWKRELLEDAYIVFSNKDEKHFEMDSKIKNLKSKIRQKEGIILKLEKDNDELKKILCTIDTEFEKENF